MNDEDKIREMLIDFTTNKERKDRACRHVVRRLREAGRLVDEPGPLRYTEEAKREDRRREVKWLLEEAEEIVERYRGLPMPGGALENLDEVLDQATRLRRRDRAGGE